ncbi:MAG: penicillin-binding protein 2 [Candidatus Liptonbacteria bacterium]|nr:penicillin-binding protein 2 [Candidatus Liptonbacteria bacterium]
MLFHLYDLQIVKGGYYLARSGAEYLAQEYLDANRGAIYFTGRNGSFLPAVLNKDFPIVYAVPKEIEDVSEAAHALAPILERPAEELKTLFSKKNDLYEMLVKKADPALASQIADLKIKGISVDKQAGRFYPLGSLASHALGFVGPTAQSAADAGHYGLEEFYNKDLSGERGSVSGSKIKKTVPGKDVVTTLDPNIQIEAERILENLVKTYKARGGSVIVEDPRTGRILAMGSYPDFDPNQYGEFPIASFLNPNVQQVYEPGSVFKAITMATGIDSGKITPDTTYYDTGTLTINGRTISNYDLKKHGPYGKATMTNVIEHSINTGAVFAERQIGREIFTAYLKDFGFSEKTGIDLPGELKGDLRRLNPKERDVAFATASYGQGVAVTPIELITAMAALANGGNLMRPYLNAELEPRIIRRVVSEETARQVTNMMISAVDNAEIAKINGFTIAGKTGTAYVPDFKKGGYTDNVINTYVGFGPASDPKFIALIKLNEPQGAPVAGLSVVPAFRDLAQFILNYYRVSPDRLETRN